MVADGMSNARGYYKHVSNNNNILVRVVKRIDNKKIRVVITMFC